MTPVNWPQCPGWVLSSPTSHMGGPRLDAVTEFFFSPEFRANCGSMSWKLSVAVFLLSDNSKSSRRCVWKASSWNPKTQIVIYCEPSWGGRIQTLRKNMLPPSSRTVFVPEERDEVACPFDVSAYLKDMTSRPPKPQYLPSPRGLTFRHHASYT